MPPTPPTPNGPNGPQFNELRRLLALKRYEQPPKETMDGFLSEFHERLADETAADAARRANSRWLRLLEWIGIPPAVPGDEAFPALRSLLALKRYEQPGREYFASFLPTLHRRLRSQTLAQPTLPARVRDLVTIRPFALAQFAVAMLLVALLGANFYDHWRFHRHSAKSNAEPAPMTVAIAKEKHPPVHYIFDPVDVEREEVVDSALLKLPMPARQAGVHFVMDSVDFSPTVYEASLRY